MTDTDYSYYPYYVYYCPYRNVLYLRISGEHFLHRGDVCLGLL